jgi:hypothetical protein
MTLNTFVTIPGVIIAPEILRNIDAVSIFEDDPSVC